MANNGSISVMAKARQHQWRRKKASVSKRREISAKCGEYQSSGVWRESISMAKASRSAAKYQ